MDDDAPLTLDDLTERVEAISALYARKFAVERDPDWFMLKLAEEVGELTQAFLVATGRTRPRGDASSGAAPDGATGSDGAASPLADEVADVLAHLLLLARSQGVDVDAAVRRKWLVWEAELSGRSTRR
ncbi:pyrophosphatase [Cellulosimicrobium cellulans]|uniref:pyrophosphatase n=1 Tax=Cellulosimicrobium cellulans TaxID=1710 RepID=UPI003018F306